MTHTDAHTDKMPVQTHAKDDKKPSAIPEGYVPQPYPAMRFDKHGNTKDVADEKADEDAKKEGFTLDAPPKPEDAAKK